MPFVGSSPSFNAILQTFLAKTPIKNKLKKPVHPTADRALPVTTIADCTAAQQTVVRDTFTRVTISYLPVIRTWGSAGVTLADEMAKFSLANTWVSCKQCFPYGSVSTLDSGDGYPEIRVCTQVPPYDAYFRQLLFQEWLLLAGATMFDVQIVQAYFRTWETWSPDPVPAMKWDGPADWLFLCRGRQLAYPNQDCRAGAYMVWSGLFGKVYVGNAKNPTKPGSTLWTQTNWYKSC